MSKLLSILSVVALIAAAPVCPEGQKFCEKHKKCVPACEEGKVYCPKAKACVAKEAHAKVKEEAKK